MRIQRVKSARKDQGDCQSCGKPILKGQSYKHFSFRYGGKQQRHEDCPEWRPSQLTSNDKIATVLGACEAAEDDLGSLELPSKVEDAEGFVEEIKSILETAAEGIREAAELYRESAQNIEDGFGHATYQSEEAESNADEVESFADTVEEFDADDVPEDDEDVEGWAEAVRDDAYQALSESPV